MHLILSFIGKLPKYILYCIYQIRIYSDLPIYLIYNDYSSKHLEKIKTHNVILVDYKKINYNYEKINSIKNYFQIVDGLNERRELFYRAFERFYLLRNLSELFNLEDIIFLEIDNLVYDDPSKWINIFKNNDVKMSFMIDNINRASTGISYFKDIYYITKLTDYFDNVYFTNNISGKFLNEMSAVYEFYKENEDDCFIMPSLVTENKIPILSQNYNKFNNIFDPASYGVYLLGYDTYHTNGKIVLYQQNKWAYIKPSNNIMWETEDGKKKPYLVNENGKILINNLHVHSKNLLNGLSIPYDN